MSMSQFGTGKNPPWARPGSDYLTAVSQGQSVAGSSLSQAPMANAILPQPGITTPTVYSLGTTTTGIGQPQYTAQHLAGLQAQAAAVVAQQAQAQATAGMPQPGIAVPTTLASAPVATVSYPAPRLSQPAQQPVPKQRVFTGSVTKLHENFGFVDEDVFFQPSCVKGHAPNVGDRVLVEATYNPNMPFKWNASRIQVLPNQQLPTQNSQQQSGKSGFNNSGNSSMSSSAGGNFSGPPPPLMAQNPQPSGNNRAGNKDVNRFSRDRDKSREHAERRERRENRPLTGFRRRSRSPIARGRSPVRKRSRPTPRYVVQVPKFPLGMKEANVMTLKSRYGNMYIPSDFFTAGYTWADVFPLERPFQFSAACNFHIMHKDVEPVTANSTVLDPQDADHLFSAKVMLLSVPTVGDMYHKSCALAEDSVDMKDSFQHPTRLIQFLVGMKGKNEPMAIGGPWSQSLDGPNPHSDLNVLIKTAIRTTKALTGIDLTNCTQWYRFAEIFYLRPEETHKGKIVPARVETTVIFLPDIWSCTPTRPEWELLQTAYKKHLQRKLDALEGKEEQTQDDEEMPADELAQPSHYSELDPKIMKIADLRHELECRLLSSKGLKSQLIARLTKCLKTEQEKEESEEKPDQGTDTPKTEEKIELDPREEEKRKEEEDRKKEKDKILLERRYNFPDTPSIIVHPSPTAKSGKFECSIMSLSVLLDYRPEDNKEHSFEVSLFAEMFNEMLMRGFGFEIYKSLLVAPEKKDDEKDKKDKEKKDDDKKDKKEREEKKSDDKETKEKASIKKEDDKGECREYNKIKEEEDDGREEDEGWCIKSNWSYDPILHRYIEEDRRDRDRKDRKKRKFITVDPNLLLSYVYFDQNHTGYIMDKDLEDVLHMLGLQLSRSQVKKLVQKVVSREMLNYRKLTDREADLTEVKKELDETLDLTQVAVGNSLLISKDKPNRRKLSTKDERTKEKSNMVSYKGSIVDLDSMMQKLQKSEEGRTTLATKVDCYTKELENLKVKCAELEVAKGMLNEELRKVKSDLDEQVEQTETAETLNRTYLKILFGAKDSLGSLLGSINEALEGQHDAIENFKTDKMETGKS